MLVHSPPLRYKLVLDQIIFLRESHVQEISAANVEINYKKERHSIAVSCTLNITQLTRGSIMKLGKCEKAKEDSNLG